MLKVSVVVEKVFMSKNYFTVLNLIPGFKIDLLELENNYLHLQKIYHADNFALDSEKSYALKQSIAINCAYQVLRAPLSRAMYIAKEIFVQDIGRLSVPIDILQENFALREKMVTGDIQLKQYIDKVIIQCCDDLHRAFIHKKVQDFVYTTLRLKYFSKLSEEVNCNDTEY